MGDLENTSDDSSEDQKDMTSKASKLEFSEDEELLIARMFRLVGKRWSLIAGRIPGRTAEEIEKYWTSRHSSLIHALAVSPSSPNPAAATTTTTTTNTKKKAKGGTWLYITHDPADPDSVLNLLFPTNSTHPPPTQLSDLVLRFEPLIIAVECKDVSSAQSLVSLGISCGFRESGITSVNKRVIVAIRCSIRLEVPLGDTNNLLVSPEYVRYLIGVANEKMEANRRRTDNFLTALLNSGFVASEIAESGNGVLANGEVDLVNEEVDNNGGFTLSEAQNSECQQNSSNKGYNGDASTERRDADATQFGHFPFNVTASLNL
ncbi:hypothetical protein F0562_014323 [Nyssa sinensis]|uniref:tRNA(Phe) 7-[(3-amino-3-carboxypropyl)-4-demethylwyosine(37)-N(4)]-methyltransferase n=1 Tax=Nyssa sinensis TaxID=561372 RepID=A0A5J4ZSD5_9ASTE|nr:hypothetical protein F0562_014323 [Nyssa sinensis]